MKNAFIFLLFFPFYSSGQIGIQTNTLGYLVMPLIDENYHSVEIALETKIMSKMALKSSLYYLKKTDFSTYNAIKVRADQMKKYGIRLASKFYFHHKTASKKLPEGFYAGPYSDIMYGKRTIYQIKHEFESDSFLQISKLAHRLRSTSLNLGATRLSEILKRIEYMTLESDLVRRELDFLIITAEKEAQFASKQLNTYLG